MKTATHHNSSAALAITAIAAVIGITFLPTAHGHGLMYEPATRNYIAKLEGKEGSHEGVPRPEYCAHCLRDNRGFCGYGESGINYDDWPDSTGKSMPWKSSGTYEQGGIIQIQTNLWAHHGGHMELKACAMGKDSTQECMDSNKLTFVSDELYGMPADPKYPERGYYYGGAGWNGFDFVMQFKLPDDLVGDKVLLQWRYITANSCSPPGYSDYFSSNNDLPDYFWGPTLLNCPIPIPLDGDTTKGPEQFFNCAEITITSNGDTDESEEFESGDAPSDPPTNADTATPTDAPISPPTGDDGSDPTKERPKLVAYMGNWHTCPTYDQYKHYTHVMIAFAVSYTWSPYKNICSQTCQISRPPVCNGNSNMINDLHAAGVKVLLSFGGAGMGGSWAGDMNDCWDYCFGREDQVIDQLVTHVNDMNLDGIDIDYEYFYEDGQKGSSFSKGTEAQFFLKEVTHGLRQKLPQDAIITHTPMDIDLLPTSAYFKAMQEVREDLSFIMPQYYNGITRPSQTGLTGSYGNSPSPLTHMRDIAHAMFDDDVSKVIFGFCIADCGYTGSNTGGQDASRIMKEVAEHNGGKTGGAFFWVSIDDVAGAWSGEVKATLDAIADSGVVTTNPPADKVTEGPTAEPTPTPTNEPTNEPTNSPTDEPTNSPTDEPTYSPTDEPTDEPTESSESSGEEPTSGPTSPPTDAAITSPTTNPTNNPTTNPTANPTSNPTANPTDQPTDGNPGSELCNGCVGSSSGYCKSDPGVCYPYAYASTKTCYPGTFRCAGNAATTDPPTQPPTQPPTNLRTASPTITPTQPPTQPPTNLRTASPTITPTQPPTVAPTQPPTITPTQPPTVTPTQPPTLAPTRSPTQGACGFAWDTCHSLHTGVSYNSCCPGYVCTPHDKYTSYCQIDDGYPHNNCLLWGGYCLNTENDCCVGLKCEGSEHYKQCVSV